MPEEWDTFFFMTGSSAAALIGLLFVVISLTSESDSRRQQVGSGIFVTPTVVHFAIIVLIGSVAVMPGLRVGAMALVVIVPCVIALAYVAQIASRMLASPDLVPHWSDYVYYAALPAIIYLCLAVSGVALWLGWNGASYALAISLLALLFLGIHDAWDLAVWMVTNRKT